MPITEANRASALQLTTALREPMPQGFEWDFGALSRPTACGSAGCAIGLAVHLGMVPSAYNQDYLLRTQLGLSSQIFDDLFYSAKPYGHDYMYEVRPEQVADALDQAMDVEADRKDQT